MEWVLGIHQLKKSQSLPRATVVTLGSFDGLHLGHRQLVDKTISLSQEIGAQSVVYTFCPHPRQVLKPDAPIIRLFDEQDQKEQLQRAGVDIVVQEPFSLSLAALDPEEFLDNYLRKPLSMKAMVIGYDFALGADRRGDREFIQDYCDRNQIRLFVLNPVQVEGEVISSTRIRNELANGNLELVYRLLGRNFYLKGEVVHGARRGRTIGFPTANLMPVTGVLPKTGVYATWAHIDGQRLLSVTNIGINPTFTESDQSPLKVECHILDQNKLDLYGKCLRVELVQYLREEIRFSGVESLVEQIKKDVILAQEVLQ